MRQQRREALLIRLRSGELLTATRPDGTYMLVTQVDTPTGALTHHFETASTDLYYDGITFYHPDNLLTAMSRFALLDSWYEVKTS